MRLLWIGVAAWAATALVGSSAYGQAFGIAEGTPVAQLRVDEQLPSSQYAVTPPSPNTAFDSYIVTATPQHGVCKVSGIGVTLEADMDGSQVRAAFRKLHDALIAQYGPAADDFDFLRAGAFWSGHFEFAAALSQNERLLASYWALDGGLRIGLIANGLTQSDTFLLLSYEFPNYDECEQALEAENNSSP